MIAVLLVIIKWILMSAIALVVLVAVLGIMNKLDFALSHSMTVTLQEYQDSSGTLCLAIRSK